MTLLPVAGGVASVALAKFSEPPALNLLIATGVKVS